MRGQRGRFDRRDFVYDKEKNTYVCPAGEHLAYRMTTEEAGKVLHRYWTNACGACALKQHCTTGKQRRVSRWKHEDVPGDGDPRCTGAAQGDVSSCSPPLTVAGGSRHMFSHGLV